MAITYETVGDTLVETNAYSRGEIEIVEKRPLRLSEAEANVAREIAQLELQIDTLNLSLANLKKKRDDFVMLRPAK